MQIFDFEDYKAYIVSRVRSMPSNGRGEFRRIANALSMHTTSVSQVFKGSKDLSLEQGSRLCLHLGLGELETDYFINLIEYARSGSHELQKIISKRLAKIRKQALDLNNRVPKDRVLLDSEKHQFYSTWHYSAIRLAADIPDFRTLDRIANRLELPVSTVDQAVQFLVATGLCEIKDGEIRMLNKRTYLEASSPLIARHHANWRLKAINRHDKMNLDREFALTAPMTLSRSDVVLIRKRLLELVEELLKINSASPSEELYLLAMDWLKI